ncbi:MAG: 50S ribosomal protein L32 [Acidobacteriota bacterium]
MPNPKRKHSKSRTGNRRAHDFLATPAINACTQCGAAVMQHRVCQKCGFYRGRKVMEVKEDNR